VKPTFVILDKRHTADGIQWCIRPASPGMTNFPRDDDPSHMSVHDVCGGAFGVLGDLGVWKGQIRDFLVSDDIFTHVKFCKTRQV